jgi:HAD superfamily hydrolase (TIGR01549 family)
MGSAVKGPRAVIFDLDGTITRPILDFARIKREIGAGDTPILEFLASMKDEKRRREARRKVDAWEREGAEASTLNPGVRELLDFLRGRGIPTAILTRNTRESVEIVMRKHSLRFDVIVTTDDRLPPKPSPEPVRHIAAALGVEPGEVLMVGDFRFDVECGRSAGARTVFLKNEHLSDDAGADYVITEMTQLLDLVGGESSGGTGTGE